MNQCNHEKWECQLYYAVGGTQIHCSVQCEGCQRKSTSNSVSHDGKTLIVRPNWGQTNTPEWSEG